MLFWASFGFETGFSRQLRVDNNVLTQIFPLSKRELEYEKILKFFYIEKKSISKYYFCNSISSKYSGSGSLKPLIVDLASFTDIEFSLKL